MKLVSVKINPFIPEFKKDLNNFNKELDTINKVALNLQRKLTSFKSKNPSSSDLNNLNKLSQHMSMVDNILYYL